MENTGEGQDVKAGERTERRDFIKTTAVAAAGLVTGAGLPVEARAIEAEEKRSTFKRQGFLLPFVEEGNYELGRQFVEDPEGVLRQLKMRPEDLVCPQEVHAAMERAKGFAAELQALDIITKEPLKVIESAKGLAPKHFGNDYQVAIIPFGLKFKERMQLASLGDSAITATGTLEITWQDFSIDLDA